MRMSMAKCLALRRRPAPGTTRLVFEITVMPASVSRLNTRPVDSFSDPRTYTV